MYLGGIVRMSGQPGLYFRNARGIKLAIDIGVQVPFFDRLRFGHLTLLSVGDVPSVIKILKRSRPRANRDMTVPTGTSITSAACL